MAETAVELDGVGKRYRLGEHHGSGADLRELIGSVARRIRHRSKPVIHEFWSLRDVTFSVHEGQALGIIGANGAGKSTLLKIVSNITTPTEGRSRTRGRVGSLLEVGTGFHAELTGFENTYLNGAILGMTRREVKRRLDEIIAFAGLEEFMDTPVKRYSSGMYLRLGFAIAAHLEADILLVDEVLAVGDAEFQRRCMGKMSEVEKSGRTVLFVSHDMDAMSRLCPTAIWLEKGRMRAMGPTDSVIRDYLRSSLHAQVTESTFPLDPDARAQITALRLVDEDGEPQALLDTRSTSWIQIDVLVNELTTGLDVCHFVSTSGGTIVLGEALTDSGRPGLSEPGRYRVRCRLDPVLTPGQYSIDVWLGTAYEDYGWHERVYTFSIEGSNMDRSTRLVKLGLEWDVERLE